MAQTTNTERKAEMPKCPQQAGKVMSKRVRTDKELSAQSRLDAYS